MCCCNALADLGFAMSGKGEKGVMDHACLLAEDSLVVPVFWVDVYDITFIYGTAAAGRYRR